MVFPRVFSRFHFEYREGPVDKVLHNLVPRSLFFPLLGARERRKEERPWEQGYTVHANKAFFPEGAFS